MNPHDKATLVARYRERVERYGDDLRALASGTAERQRLRFDALAAVGDLDGASLLDLGCGRGDFYRHLRAKGVEVDYTGYDLSPDLLALAAARCPHARFERRDIQEEGIPRRFDFIVSSQVFNNRLEREDNLELVKDVIARCYAACDRGFALDLLSSYVDFREPHLFYYSPEEVFRFCKGLTKRVALRHDYPLFEFTVYLYPDFAGWRAEG